MMAQNQPIVPTAQPVPLNTCAAVQPVQQSLPPLQSQPPAPQSQQSKEFNTVSLCRIGQETVQDIVSRTQEVFQTLKTTQPPNGTVQGKL